MVKSLKKVGIEGDFLNPIKGIREKSTANITLTGERLKTFPLKSGTRQRCLFSSLLVYIVLESLVSAFNHESKIKVFEIGEQEVNLFQDWKTRSKTVSIHRCHDVVFRKS